MKAFLRKIAKSFNLLLADTSRIGIELENDLSRLHPADQVSVVFDVGANHGQSAIRFARAFPSATVYSFEPVAANFALLQAKCGSHSRIRPVRKGLGRSAGKAMIGLSDNPGGHSVLLGGSGAKTETVELSTIDESMRDFGVDRIDLLKLDVEGFELEVLHGAKEALSTQRVRHIYAECIFAPDGSSPHTLFPALSAFLEPYGFSLFACYHESFHLGAGSAMGNVLFVNRSLLPETASGRVKNIF